MNTNTISVTKAYPLDSSEPIEFDEETGLPKYDRAYNASDLRRVMSLILTDGVFPDDGDELLVSNTGDQWSVGTGTFVAHGLVVPVAQKQVIITSFGLTTGQYAFVVAAGRFDSNTRDGAIYTVVENSPNYTPTRNESVWELVLARIDWRGEMRDLRLDPAMCGAVAPVIPVDTDSFMAELKTAVSQFNLTVGEVESLPAGTSPTVTVNKPEQAGGEVTIDFGIPRGAPGEPGKDGDSVPTMYIQEDEPPKKAGNVWLMDDTGTSPHTITSVRVYELATLFPGSATYPGSGVYPGGTGQWQQHVFSAGLFTGGGSGGTANMVSIGQGEPTQGASEGDLYIDLENYDLYAYEQE